MGGSVSKDSARGFRIFSCRGCLRGGGHLEFGFCSSVQVSRFGDSCSAVAKF